MADDYEDKTPHVGNTTTYHNGLAKDKLVCTLTREIDAQHHEEKYLKAKYLIIGIE